MLGNKHTVTVTPLLPCQYELSFVVSARTALPRLHACITKMADRQVDQVHEHSLSPGSLLLSITFLTASLTAAMVDVNTTVDSLQCGLANAKFS